MALDATQQLTPGSGHIYVASVGATAPTDSTSSPGSGWLELGFVTDDGVEFEEAPEFRDQTAWQALLPIGKVKTGEKHTAKFALKQWNKNTVSFAWGGGTWSTPSSNNYKFTPPGVAGVDYRALIIDGYDGSYYYRRYYARGLADDSVQTKWSRADDAILPITFDVTPANDTDAPYLFFTNNPAFA